MMGLNNYELIEFINNPKDVDTEHTGFDKTTKEFIEIFKDLVFKKQKYPELFI